MLDTEIEGLWTVDELARFLNMSGRWVRKRLCYRPEEQGSIPHVRFGRTPRFDPTEIRAWVQAGTPPASDWAAWQRKKVLRHI
jgi:excisionase family DNA binding protein